MTPALRPLALVALLGLAACDRGTPDAATPAARPVEPPLAATTADFAKLRWLEGDWHGSGGGVDAFFERYRWVDDSTIRKYDFTDSTFDVTSDSGDVTLRGGTVRNGSPDRSWVVVALDSASVRFAPERNASNGFEWRRTSPMTWTARLTWDSAGTPKERVYEMRAVAPLVNTLPAPARRP